MTKEEFMELEKENKYIYNLINAHVEAHSKKLDALFTPLKKDMKALGFMLCVHFHVTPIRVSIFNDTTEDAQSLVFANFEVLEATDNFDPLVRDIVEKWLGDLT